MSKPTRKKVLTKNGRRVKSITIFSKKARERIKQNRGRRGRRVLV